MTKLKTLKDLWGMKGDTRKSRVFIINDFKDELKAEAMKWVKLYDKQLKTNNLIQNFIRTFFNLTEKDLEEKNNDKEKIKF